MILSIDCKEKEGIVTHTVRELIFTPENLYAYWNKAKKHRVLFWQDVSGDFKEFVKALFYETDSGELRPKGLYYVVDDFVGVFALTKITPLHDALCHFAFLDRRLKGRENLIKAMMKHVFDEYKFHRLSVDIAHYASPFLFTFVESLGFKKEGKRREYLEFDGKRYHMSLYYMLARDFNEREKNASTT